MRRSMPKNKAFIIPIITCFLILFALLAYIIYKPHPPIKENAIDMPTKIQKSEKSDKTSETIKPATKLTIAPEKPIFDENIPPVPRTTSKDKMPLTEYKQDGILEFSDTPINYAVGIRIAKPVSTNPTKINGFWAHTKIPMEKTDSADVVPNSSAMDKKSASILKKDLTERYIRVASEPKARSRLIRFEVKADETGIAKMAESIRLGFEDVEPLLKGEPGGRMIGRGRDIQGVFRFARIQHNLSDWWADQTSLIGLTEWLNRQTRIKTDMNVEGGAIRLTDPKLLKSPLLFFTGHDPSNVRSRNLMYGGPLKNRLSAPERNGLRKYLIDKKGFIFFDDCGVNAPAQEFLRLMMAQIKYAMPEYSVNKIPNNHEVYNNFYEMGGPPIGFDIFWWGTHPPKRNFLEGITIGDHLGVIVCRRDYMCSMETFSMPSKTVHYSPGVYRFLTNVVIYALTHGGISDYTHYVPGNDVTDRIPIDKPTGVPSLE